MSPLSGKKILIVDDEVDLLDCIIDHLARHGTKLFRAENVEAALEILAKEEIEILVSDIRLPGNYGTDLLKGIKALSQKPSVIILMSGYSYLSNAEASQIGANHLIQKPFKMTQLVELITESLGRLPNG